MSDARFDRFKTDPRFRRPKKYESKVILDDRFKDLLGDASRSEKKKGTKKSNARVDKYGRKVSEFQEKDDLRRFYRLGTEDPAIVPPIVDYARGAVLMESSDEEDGNEDLPPHVPSTDGSDSDEGGFVSLGVGSKKLDEDEEDLEIDLDENTIATLDAQAAEYSKAVPDKHESTDVVPTRRLAVVNLDWDYVRAAHLYKIFSSLVSPTAPLASTSLPTEKTSGRGMNIARGKILGVHVYPSEFGKKRMAREENEGPPTELFRTRSKKVKDEEINERTIFETGDEADYDEDALRKYQLERLRYYYAIIECDTVESATHVYNELEGTELERTANVFDLSFVPDEMSFEDEPRDEATQLSNTPYRAVEFVTDALRHSKVKLTWDEDDPERNHVLRRPLTKKEIDEADFRAYIASSSSSEGGFEDEHGDEGEPEKTGEHKTKNEGKGSKRVERDKLRTLLLGGDNDELPEGWGNVFDNRASRTGGGEDNDVDMEVTFTPGLSETRNAEDENTLDRYQRKLKERRKKKKEGAKKRADVDDDDVSTKKIDRSGFDDEFFGVESDSRHEEEKAKTTSNQSEKKSTEPKKPPGLSKAELALLASSDNPYGEPAHFDMKAVLKAEKQGNKKSRHKLRNRDRSDADDEPGETQDDFVIDVKDDRFAAVHEDHQFAIDPTNPQFKKTKSMTALLDERSKRQKSKPRPDHPVGAQTSTQQDGRSLQSLVESVKRKSISVDHGGLGKRRKLGKS